MNRIVLVLALITINFSCSQDQDPNIILINIDDMGWRDVGFMGSEYYETPNIDKLASEGMVFNQAYASASNCAPSRACMMSGQWTPRHGIYTVANSDRGKSKTRKLIPTKNTTVLADEFYTLAEALKDYGYLTCHAGKWHLTEDPKTQGFDVNIGGSHAGNPGSYYPPYKNVDMEAPTIDYYLTNLIMDKTIQFVESLNQEKFFLYYSPYAVHTPIQAVTSLLDKYENKPAWNGQDNAKYATMVDNIDRQIGRLITSLEENNKLDNTLIIFTSDNGGLYKVTKQWPLRAGKGSYYEGGIREPMFVWWPGKVEANRRSEIPVSNLDFYPTLIDILDIELPENQVLDGNSMLPVLMGQETNERPLFWHFPIYLEGGNTECQDLVFRTRPGSALRLGDWKLIEYYENGDLELYNLKDDVGETNNLAEANPEKLQELLNILRGWRSKTNAPVPKELNPEFSDQ